MILDTKQIVSITEANQNFSKVANQCEENGSVVIFKNNKPKFVLLDIETMDIDIMETDERLDDACKRVLDKAKWL